MESKDKVQQMIRQAIEDSWESEESEESVVNEYANGIEEIYSEKLESFRTRAIAELEGMRKEAHNQADIFREQSMETSEMSSRAMAHAYDNSIERLRNLK